MADGAINYSISDAKAALAARLWRAAELQAAEVEARMATGPRPVAESEKDARVLSVLARTLRELSAVEANCREESGDDDDDAAPDDIDELRQALGERMQKLTVDRKRTTQPV